MAHKTMSLTALGVQSYRTRMLVGDPIRVSGADAKLLARLGWAEEPKRRKPVVEQAAPVVEETPAEEAPETPAPKRGRPKLSAKT